MISVRFLFALSLTITSFGLSAGCAGTEPALEAPPRGGAAVSVDSALVRGPGPEPTVAAAVAFVDSAEAVLHDLSVRYARASWVQSTYITDDTQILAAQAAERLVTAGVHFAAEAARFEEIRSELPPDVARKLDFLRTRLTTPAPQDPAKTAELTRITTEMESRYGSGEFCPEDGACFGLQELTEILATSRDPDSLRWAWEGWPTVSVPMREDYARFVELSNEGARDLGFEDLGAMWRSNYDMPADSFAAELDRLWTQVRPLYDALHCHVRARLAEAYGTDVVAPGEPIPAHLLGNMWAQDWSNVYELVAPPQTELGYDLTERLRAEGYDARTMVRAGERFFTSLGLPELPETFWERSLFVKPEDRDVVCHASAWNVDDVEDVRIKMCIVVNATDFQTIHHELGHNYYQLAYNEQPYLFRGSANDGFHEALGDAVALSITPEYLQEIGLIETVPPPSEDVGLLLRDALDKVAFLPFGLLVDKWRWQVFSGEITPAEYNRAWWELRRTYQGIAPPSERTEAYFDPGAKYHVPAVVPYARYFLAEILQFQFHRALCEASGFDGPLNRCSIYGNEEAGRRLAAMMALGKSRPWQEALEALTGSRAMDATALLDYFEPLKAWLDEQNAGRSCGW